MPLAPPVRRSRQISWAPAGWLISSVTAHDCTELLTLTCPGDFVAVRVGFTNLHPEPYVVARVIAAASTTPGDHCNPTGVTFWRPLTFVRQGVASDRIVSAADAPTHITVWGNQRDPVTGDPGIPRWTWTDWAPVASLGRTDQIDAPRVLMLRVLLRQGCHHTNPNGGFMEYNKNADINRGSSYVAGEVPIDTVSVPVAINAQAANLGIANPAISCVQFLTRNEGIVGMTTGDSHHQGTSTTTQFWNYLLRSTNALTAKHGSRIPFGYWSTAQGGKDSAWFFTRLTDVLEVARPGFVVLPGWTYNEMTFSEHADHAANANFLARLLMTAEACVQAGALPIFLTPFPRNPAAMAPAQLGPWRELRDSILALAATGAVVLDTASILTRRSNQQLTGTFLPQYTDDHAHPNNAGHAAIANALTPIIERACGLT